MGILPVLWAEESGDRVASQLPNEARRGARGLRKMTVEASSDIPPRYPRRLFWEQSGDNLCIAMRGRVDRYTCAK
jgi:hypothetical protein